MTQILTLGRTAQFHEMAHWVPSTIEVRHFLSLSRAARHCATAHADVGLVLIAGDSVPADEALTTLMSQPGCARAKGFVLTAQPERADLAGAVDAGFLDALIVTPTATADLKWLVLTALRDLDETTTFDLVAAPEVGVDLMHGMAATESQRVSQLVDGLDRALGRRPRLLLPSGIRLTREKERTDGIFILLDGRVALTRSTQSEDLLLHHDSTGRLIGLMALTQQREAFFTSTTTSDVTAVFVSFEQLQRAMLKDPTVGLVVAVSAMHGLAQRLARSEELQVERVELNRKLEREQRRLGRTLRQLEKARVELVSQAKFATLGELSAGIAHELNNPVAALDAAARHLPDDVAPLLASHPKGEILTRAVHNAEHRAALSTSEERALLRRFETLTGDPQLAWRLVAAGVTDEALAAQLAPSDLRLLEAASALGTSARNITIASARIAELVRSLRSYARPETEWEDDVDVNDTIEAARDLVSHRLFGIEVVRHYGSLTPIHAHPSQLGQVWTNLLVNAADALGASGHITIQTAMRDPEHVQVTIADDGPGITPRNLTRIFQPSFTTKHGTVRYGLGLGLSLSRSIVEAHHGSIGVESEPGHTVFTVILPLTGTPEEE